MLLESNCRKNRESLEREREKLLPELSDMPDLDNFMEIPDVVIQL